MITNEDIDWIRAELNRRVAVRAANGFKNAREEERYYKQKVKESAVSKVETKPEVSQVIEVEPKSEPIEVEQERFDPVNDITVSEVSVPTEDKKLEEESTTENTTTPDFSFADEFYDNLVNDVQLYSKSITTESEEVSAADDIIEETYRTYPLIVSESIYSEEPIEFDSRHLKLGQAPPIMKFF